VATSFAHAIAYRLLELNLLAPCWLSPHRSPWVNEPGHHMLLREEVMSLGDHGWLTIIAPADAP